MIQSKSTVMDARHPVRPNTDGMNTFSPNEQAWIDFIRLITLDSDPAPTLRRVQRLRGVFAKDSTSFHGI